MIARAAGVICRPLNAIVRQHSSDAAYSSTASYGLVARYAAVKMPLLTQLLVGWLFALPLAECSEAESERPVYEALFANLQDRERPVAVDIRSASLDVPPMPSIRKESAKSLDGFTFSSGKDHPADAFAGMEVRLLSESESQDVSRDCHLWSFHARHPQATLYRLSRVEFHGNKAGIYIETHCGCLCGSGGVYFFERTPNGWKLSRIAGLWVS